MTVLFYFLYVSVSPSLSIPARDEMPSNPDPPRVRSFLSRGRLTCGRDSGLVSLLVGAHSPAVEQRVQGLLLPAPRQAAEALAAGSGVDAARMPLGERARQAAAAARLLHQLAAERHRRTHGHRLVVTGLARDVRAQASGQPQEKCHEEAKAQEHGCRFFTSETSKCEEEGEK